MRVAHLAGPRKKDESAVLERAGADDVGADADVVEQVFAVAAVAVPAPDTALSAAAEELLLDAGRVDEACARYGIQATSAMVSDLAPT